MNGGECVEYRKATAEYADAIFQLVQDTIAAVYPRYYPREVVEFFSQHHRKERIIEDIDSEFVYILLINNCLVGTGSHKGNEITRVFVAPDFQGQGYGSYIIQALEHEISLEQDMVCLDASLPASHLYERRGYKTVRHEKRAVENGAVLVYEIMEKPLPPIHTVICYNGKYFIPKRNTENGEVDRGTVFSYHQSGNLLWAEYSGGEVIKGSLIGTVKVNGELDFYYQHINHHKQVRIGKCHSVPTVLENGKIQLAEEWQWLNGHKSRGTSVLTERE